MITLAHGTFAAPLLLTGAYVASSGIKLIPKQRIAMYVKYTNGDEISMDVELEMTYDGTNWFVCSLQQGVKHVFNMTATANLRIGLTGPVPTVSTTGLTVGDVADDEAQLRVKVKANGGTPTGTVFVALLHDRVE